MKSKWMRLLALALACVLLSAAAGCDPAAPTSESSPEASAAGEDEVYPVKLMYFTMMTVPSEAAQKQVEDAVNAYLKEKGYPLALDMEILPTVDYETAVSLALSGGEPMDIIDVRNLQEWVNNGYLAPLNGYLDRELAGIRELEEEWLVCGTVDGTLYSIPCHKGWALTWKYIYDASYVEQLGYDMSTVTGFDDLLPLFAALKQAYPELLVEGDTSRYPELFNDIYDTSLYGIYFATVGDDPLLVNYFETEAFRKAIEYAYEFRQKGYSSPDGSTNVLNADALVNAGFTIGVTMRHGQNAESMGKTFTASNTYGGVFQAVELGEIADQSTMTLNGGVASTSQNPAAAAEMLNLIWTDEFILNTLIYGLEGVSWEWNGERTAIRYPEGLNAETVPYTTLLNCGAISDQFKMYPFEGNSTAEDLEYMQDNMEKARFSPLFGFTPNAAQVAAQAAAVSNVYSQYYDALRYGDVDPALLLPEFLSALKGAGIDDMLAEYRRQAEAWLAAR